MLGGLLASAGCGESASGPLAPPAPDQTKQPARPVTFNRDIAPIIYRSCTNCHRPGQSGPFDLLTYEDVSKRAQQIVQTTQSRFMPPWLPAPVGPKLLRERRLSNVEINLIRRWAEQGALRGNPDDLPPTPRFADGWLLGEPDLVVEMAEPYTLASKASDVFRNFVLPVPIERGRWVNAVELRPGNPKYVHHAVMHVDSTPDSRWRDEQDPGLGFGGMEIGGGPPGGYSIGWAPGNLPIASDNDLAWRLEPGTDLIVQLHMQPSGKPEPITARVGFHFTDTPPKKTVWLFTMQARDIDIPPGKKDYIREDQCELPVDVHLFSLYPHAHYLGKDMKVLVALPNGSIKRLLHIPDWDFNRQEEYRFETPVLLPKGSVIFMRFTYDNSSDNARNPNNPPKRVRTGNQSTDEMGNLGVLVIPHDKDELEVLQEAIYRQNLAKAPYDSRPYIRLASLLHRQSRYKEAIELYQANLAIRGDRPKVHYNLALALMEIGRGIEAIPHFAKAVDSHKQWIEPTHALAWLLATHPAAEARNPQRAAELAERASQLSGHADAAILDTLAAAYASDDRFDLAVQTAQQALDVARKNGDESLAHDIANRLLLFRQSKPYRDEKFADEAAQ